MQIPKETCEIENDLKSIQLNFKTIFDLALLIHPHWTEFEALSNISLKFDELISLGAFQNGNIHTRQFAVSHFSKYSAKIIRALRNFVEQKQKKFKQKFRNHLKKLLHFANIQEKILKLEVDDYACLAPDHERVKLVKKNTKTGKIEDQQGLSERLGINGKSVIAAKVAFWNSMKFSKNWCRDLLAGSLYLFHLYFQGPLTRERVKKYDSSLYIEYQQALWGLKDTKYYFKTLESQFQKINFKQKIYVPRLCPPVLSPCEFDQNKYILEDYPVDDLNQLTQPSDSRIQIRIMSSRPFPFLLPQRAETQFFDKVIVHIHGGGFLSGTSYAHQNYMRVWANETGVPVFSIEYRLAPQHPFPAGLDDVWQAYYWIVNHSFKYLGLNPITIAVTGDSAGGNLATALTIKCIESGFRVPDHLLLLYPVTNLDPSYFSKSLNLAYKGGLGHDIWRIMNESYLENEKDLRNPLVSPVFAAENTIKRFPRTDVILPVKDTFYFDTERFVEKLLRAGVTATIYEYPDGVHGMVNMGNQHSVPQFSVSVATTCEIYQEVFK